MTGLSFKINTQLSAQSQTVNSFRIVLTEVKVPQCINISNERTHTAFKCVFEYITNSKVSKVKTTRTFSVISTPSMCLLVTLDLSFGNTTYMHRCYFSQGSRLKKTQVQVP